MMKKTVSQKQTVRQWWLAVHLYLGLILGLLFSVTGMTGSLLVFYLDIDEILNPELQLDMKDSSRQSYEAIFKSLQKAEPQRKGSWRLEIPADPQRMISARYYTPIETKQAYFAPLILSVDPYSGEVVKRRFWGQFAMTWIYDLHYALLLGKTGKILMAIIGGLLLISIMSGMYLWWPPVHKLRSALTIKSNASFVRMTYDVHKVTGVQSLMVVFILSLTGIALAIPEYVNPVINSISALRPAPKPQSQLGLEDNNRITLDQAVDKAQQLFPSARLCWIVTPKNITDSYRINLRQDFEPSLRFPKTNIWVDQYSGGILAVNDPKDFTAGETLLIWLHPLHNGEVFGLPGRILVIVAGIACPLLFVTGLLRWLQKRRARRQVTLKT